jgi:hypothetical protein
LKKFLVLIFFFSTANVFGFDLESYEDKSIAKNVITLSGPSDINSVSKKYYPIFKKSYYYMSIDDYKERLLKWNRHIQNWKSLRSGQRLFVFSPYSAHLGFEWSPVLKPKK